MAKQGGSDSFEERLRSAREQNGLDPSDQPGRSPANSAWGMGARVGVELVAAVVVATAIGAALDWFCHTSPVFLMIGIPLGGVAGILNVWRVAIPRRD